VSRAVRRTESDVTSPTRTLLYTAALLATLAACGSPAAPPAADAGAPLSVAKPTEPKVGTTVGAAPDVVASAAPVEPAGPPVERRPLTLLVTADVWGEYAPCG